MTEPVGRIRETSAHPFTVVCENSVLKTEEPLDERCGAPDSSSAIVAGREAHRGVVFIGETESSVGGV